MIQIHTGRLPPPAVVLATSIGAAMPAPCAARNAHMPIPTLIAIAKTYAPVKPIDDGSTNPAANAPAAAPIVFVA